MTYLLLALLGLLTCVYSILEANDLPEKLPVQFGLESALTFAAGVGAIVFSAFQDTEQASACLLGAIVLQALFIWDARRQGYRLDGAFINFTR